MDMRMGNRCPCCVRADVSFCDSIPLLLGLFQGFVFTKVVASTSNYLDGSLDCSLKAPYYVTPLFRINLAGISVKLLTSTIEVKD